MNTQKWIIYDFKNTSLKGENCQSFITADYSE